MTTDKPAGQKMCVLILARGGSETIPLKNIKPLAGVPLIGWVLRAAIAWRKVDEVWVSTDHEDIAQVSEEYGARVHWRPECLARNDTPSLDAALEFLNHHPETEILALLQCTSPCLQPQYLDEALKMITGDGYDSVFAVARQHKLRWQETEKGSTTKPLNFDPKRRPRRQDWPGELVESGMFYFTKVKRLLQERSFQAGKCGYVEIQAAHSIDIDTPLDWLIAEAVVKYHGFHSKNEIL